MINPRIIEMPAKIFMGKRVRMSFSNNKTFALWSSFMPAKRTIRNVIGTELYSIEIYRESFFNQFNPDAEFEKWAAVEVSDYITIPKEMECLVTPAGLYAVFLHKGPASEGPKTYRYIFETWLPASEYLLDERPHFAIMGDKYKNDDPDSEEELYIPVKKKN